MKVQSHGASVQQNRPKSCRWMSAACSQNEILFGRHRGSTGNPHPAAREDRQRNFAEKQNWLQGFQALALSVCNDYIRRLLSLASSRAVQTGRVKTNEIRFPALVLRSGSSPPNSRQTIRDVLIRVHVSGRN